MASIDKRSGKWRVHWRDPDGQARSRTCPTRASATRLKAEVEQHVAEGRRWEPRDAREEPDIEVMLRAYAAECARVLKPNTAVRYARALDLFLRYLRDRFGGSTPLRGELLTRRLLAEFYDDLATGGLHGNPRSQATQRKITEVVQLAWAWLYDDDELGEHVPPPRTLRMAREPAAPTVAPTWAEMDACIAALSGWQRDVAFLLRCTGLRVQQAMELRWSDFDLHRGLLTIRGELGKSKQEQRGRRVPVTRHLVDELQTWDRTDDNYLVTSTRHRGSDRERMARSRDAARGWQRAGVREAVWRKRPHHAFRKGLVSGLKRAGADPDAVEYLVGHSLGLRGVYIDPEALPLRATVDLIPPVTTEPRFDGLDQNDPRPIREITLGRDEIAETASRISGRQADRTCPPRVPRRTRRRGNVVFPAIWNTIGGPYGMSIELWGGSESGDGAASADRVGLDLLARTPNLPTPGVNGYSH